MKLNNAPDGLLLIKNQNVEFVVKHTDKHGDIFLYCAVTGKPWRCNLICDIECSIIRLTNIKDVILAESFKEI